MLLLRGPGTLDVVVFAKSIDYLWGCPVRYVPHHELLVEDTELALAALATRLDAATLGLEKGMSRAGRDTGHTQAAQCEHLLRFLHIWASGPAADRAQVAIRRKARGD